MEETALVRAEDDREEGSEGFDVVLFREEVEVVREGTGACISGCEVGGSLGLGVGLAAASASSFSRALIFRERESTWKLSFLRSLSTLGVESSQNMSEEWGHNLHSQQVFIIGPLDFGTLLFQILLHLVVPLLQFLEATLQTRFLPENLELALQCDQGLLMLSVLE